MDYNVQAKDLTLVAKHFEGTGIPEPYVRKVYKAAESITDLFARAEAAEAAQETLQRAMAEYKARAEKAEHNMKRIVNQSSYPCEYCTKRKCSSTIRKRKCFDFEWRGQKEE